MNQKFIFAEQKTSKKVTLFSDQKVKKFNRKRSDSDRSIDSKKSREDSVNSIYIKGFAQSTPRITQIHHEAASRYQRINITPFTNSPLQTDRSRKLLYSRTNSSREKAIDSNDLNVKLELLEVQNQAKDGEFEKLKFNLNEERQKRRKAENERRGLAKELEDLQKSNERLTIENKTLLKQKEYFIKQVQFLEKINYDEKTRQLQSFRETHMAEELERLRLELRSRKTSEQLSLERECQKLRHQRDTASQMFQSMKSYVEVLKAKTQRLQQQIMQDKQITKQKVMVSVEYLELKQRYKRFIQTYKEVRAQNWNLKKILEGKEEDLVLSEEDEEPRR